MTEGKLVFLQKGYRVVPEEPTAEMIGGLNSGFNRIVGFKNAIAKAPQLTTPPVLRWEGEWLILGDEKIAVSTEDHYGCFWVTLLQNDIGGRCESMEAGRRAAEKALGFPDGLIIEEV